MDAIPRRVKDSLAASVVFGPVLLVWWMIGSCQGQSIRQQRAEYDAIRRAEQAGPLRSTLWAHQELKKGKIVRKIVTTANAPAIWLGDEFGELGEMQRGAILETIYKERLAGKTKKPVAVSLYDVTSTGKQGKKVGSYLPTTGLKWSAPKFRDAPDEPGDSEEEIFPLDKK